MAPPRLWLLAGPNGAGKSTYARQTFAQDIAGFRFLNADDIARGIAPEDVEGAALEAGRHLLQRRAALIAARQSFIVETTLSGLTLLRLAQEVRGQGYRFRLTYIYVSDPEICIERIAHRVVRGGHFIPADTVLRRYGRSLQLLPRYLEAADEAEVFAGDSDPRLVLRKDDHGTRVADQRVWARIRAAGRSS